MGVGAGRGISPIVALVIVVGITLIVSLAFFGWVLGFWNVSSGEKSEGIYFYHDTYYNSTEGRLYIHMFTHIRPEIIVVDVNVPGVDTSGLTVVSVEEGNAYTDSDGVHIGVGSRVWLRVDTSSIIPAGSMVHYKVYTANGFVYWGECPAKS